MPQDLFALAGQAQAGVPIVTYDPASVDDLIVIMRVDTHSPNYARKTYGDLCPGVPDINGGVALYTNFILIDSPVFPGDPRFILRIYQALPGTPVTDSSYTEEVRGRIVDKITTKGASGTIEPQIGSGIISSIFDGINEGVGNRTTTQFRGGSLPDEEVYYYWDFTPIPSLLFSITPDVFCNETSVFSVVVNYVKTGGNSQMRKHRVTVNYYNTAPDTMIGDVWTTRDIRFDGKAIQFAFNNVLNDAITFTGNFYLSSGGCYWTEAYTYAATTPSASDFAGNWYTLKDIVTPFGTSGYRRVTTEFYA